MNKPWQPQGWREDATAFKLSAAEMDSLRARRELRVAPFDLIDLRLAADAAAVNAALPPICREGARGSLRILALRVESSDCSAQAFYEAWLLAYGGIASQRGWYALSHIVGDGGDLVFGREVFGYPSRQGEIELGVMPEEFFVEVRRGGRSMFSAEGSIRGASTGTSLSLLNVFTLQAGPFGPAAPSRPAQILAQTWHFQGNHLFVEPEALKLDLPQPDDAETAGTDTWFEFQPIRLVSAAVLVSGSMQRGPARSLAELRDFEPYYRERCDGVLPGEPSGKQVPPTFLIQPAPPSQSAWRPIEA
jgi:hypothetical protein